MALEKAEAVDKIVISTRYNIVKLRTAMVFVEDGVQQAVRYKHTELSPGSLDAENNLVDRDISGYSTEIQGVCNAVWTDAIKLEYKNHLIANKG
tara:strand:- start:73 stop:354 length:282 start_codon:yes stop_codon:yes gene_type:complete